MGPLAHFQMLGDHPDPIVGADAHEGIGRQGRVELVLAGKARAGFADLGQGRQRDPECQADTRREARLQEIAARHIDRGWALAASAHQASPSAARRTACLIRW